jgi:hypothetical protein
LPEDIEQLFQPVLIHRVTFRPSFLAEARTVGWTEAIGALQRACLAVAPRPRPEDGATFARAT